MATTLTTELTNVQAGALSKGPYRQIVDVKTFELAASELDAADMIVTSIGIPSNAVGVKLECYNDDLDTHTTPTLVVDIGYAASEKTTTVTSGTTTVFAQNAVLDADILVDGVTTLDTATTNWTSLTPDPATNGPEDAEKQQWEILGYDKDPGTKFNIAITISAAAATAAAGTVSLRATYLVPN